MSLIKTPPTHAIASTVYPIRQALLVFIDIKNSSTYCEYYKLGEYARLVETFREKFNTLAEIFLNQKEHIDNYHIECRGDEGFICIFFPEDPSPAILEKKREVLRIFSFLIILKAILHIYSKDITNSPIDIAVGINYGKVAIMEKDTVCGYDINFTKRIESESRNNLYCGIFVSESIKEILKYENIILSPHRCEIKGISHNPILYEVQYAFINIRENITDKEADNISAIFKNKSLAEINFNHSILLSLYYLFHELNIDGKKEYFEQKLNGIIFHTVHERDPTILLLRAQSHINKKSFLSAVHYFKKALEYNPEYTKAAIELASLLKEMPDFCRGNVAEAKAIAKDLIDNFSDVIGKDNLDRINNALKSM